MKLLCLAASILLSFLVLDRLASAADQEYRVGLLSSLAPVSDDSDAGVGLRHGLAKHDYRLDKNLVFERRGAQGHTDRLPGLVAELVAAKVDVIVTYGFPPALAAKQGAGTVPIVVIFAGDPVGTGLVASLARPGGNITGISDVSTELAPKRLELLKDAAPALHRVAMLWNADDLGMTLRYRASSAVAEKLGIEVVPLGVRAPDDFEAAFAAMTNKMPDGILMVSDVLTTLNRQHVFDFAAAHKLPAIYEFSSLVKDGGLMSYGPNQSDVSEGAADLIDRILKGAKPAELPLQQPTRYVFAINLKTAKAIGLTLPPAILARADEVIE